MQKNYYLAIDLNVASPFIFLLNGDNENGITGNRASL